MDVLEIHGLAYRRQAFELRIDLMLPGDSFGVLLGPSGCGKSTALRLIAGLLTAEAGSIMLGGKEISGLPPDRRRVGLVFQDLALFGHMSARRNIEYGPRLAGAGKAESGRISSELAQCFRISALLDRLPSELSGGEQQRVALARSLAAKPALLLLDEPLSSLDATLRRELRSEIKERVKERGVSALHVTHDIEEALALADKLFIMQEGRIVESGTPRELYDSPRSAFAARLLGRGPLVEIHALEFGMAGVRGKSAFGAFSCPLPESADAKTQWCLHFPRQAGKLVTEAQGSQDNLFEASLVSASYLGSGWRLRLRSGPVAGSRPGWQEAEMEVEITDSECPLPGQIVRLAIPSSACHLVRA